METQINIQEIEYKKPVYDPFIVFNPPMNFIKEKIKEMEIEAGAIERSKIQGWGFPRDYPVPTMDEPRKKLLTRASQYRFRLSQRKRFGNWESNSRKGEITPADIELAKQYPITNLYAERGRSSTKRKMGKCPFHADDTASFMIYLEQNSWWCYGACGIGGDVIDYIMKRDGIKFIDAVKLLINKE